MDLLSGIAALGNTGGSLGGLGGALGVAEVDDGMYMVWPWTALTVSGNDTSTSFELQRCRRCRLRLA
jgi:hypothetical protein